MPQPTPDTQAPALILETIDGERWTLAERSPENFSMVVFYRGHHCPVCKGYLVQLNNIIDDYRAAGVDVVAVSMNDRDTAAQSKAEWSLDKLDLAYGLDEATARQWGLYISKSIKESEPGIFNEPGLFLVRPDGRLYMISIASMPFGRPDPKDLLGKIGFVVEKGYPARGTA